MDVEFGLSMGMRVETLGPFIASSCSEIIRPLVLSHKNSMDLRTLTSCSKKLDGIPQKYLSGTTYLTICVPAIGSRFKQLGLKEISFIHTFFPRSVCLSVRTFFPRKVAPRL